MKHAAAGSMMAGLLMTTFPLTAAGPMTAGEEATVLREAFTALVSGNAENFDTVHSWDATLPKRLAIEDLTIEGDTVRLVVDHGHLSTKAWTPESQAEAKALLERAAAERLDRDVEVEVFGLIEEGEEPVAWDRYVISPENIRQRSGSARRQLDYPVVQHPEYPGPERTGGLENMHLVVSPSHGWTWHKEQRWQLQRARVYTIVEDLYTQSYMYPFLTPMLENAGATVFMTRERDYNTAEVIVDNDAQPTKSRFVPTGNWELAGQGWRGGRPVALNNLDQPFTMGTAVRTSAAAEATATYIPYIPAAGKYAVYASWEAFPDNSPSVPYIVKHLGGETVVRVNQQVAGGTWVYLGHFDFDGGTNEEAGSVMSTTDGAADSGEAATFISADAVRFGGGMGNVAPDGLISGKPRYAESARYWTQYAGADPDSVYNTPQSEGHFHENYNQDITSRGEFANWLQGTPNYDGAPEGLGVPIDAMISWHTDAGGERDGLIGTLSIYSTRDNDGDRMFPDGRDRFLNRDLMGLVSQEIERTGRELYTSTWAMRDMWDRGYGEARRPNMPSLLLELLSHHNFNDMKYGLDPRFKFDMSRAIYKGVVRFLAHSYGFEPVIQPLPVHGLAAISNEDGGITVSWEPTEDPLEPTAAPDGYIVYYSDNGRGFDDGRYTTETSHTFTDLAADENHYFQVSAANTGGHSLPSAIVGARWSEDAEPVLVVDGFDRISGPEIIDEEDTQGFARQIDPGVGYHFQYGVVGDQYDFDFNAAWYNDLEGPGRGATGSYMEDHLEPGNFFNHIVVQGESLGRLGRAFDSATAEAFAAGRPDKDYGVISWIAGEQKTVPPPPGITREGTPDRMEPEFQVLTAEARERLADHVDNGGGLIISGAYLGWDLIDGPLADDNSRRFAREVLAMDGYTQDATELNTVHTNNEARGFENLNEAEQYYEEGWSPRHLPSPPWKTEYFPDSNIFHFGTTLEYGMNLEDPVYAVEQPSAFTPANGEILFEYGDTGLVAGYATDNVVVLGFPLEAVLPPFPRTGILMGALERLEE